MNIIQEEYDRAGKFKYTLNSKHILPSHFTPTNNLFLRFNKDILRIRFKTRNRIFVEYVLKKQGKRYVGCCLKHQDLIIASIGEDILSLKILRKQWELRNLILSGFLNNYCYN